MIILQVESSWIYHNLPHKFTYCIITLKTEKVWLKSLNLHYIPEAIEVHDLMYYR